MILKYHDVSGGNGRGSVIFEELMNGLGSTWNDVAVRHRDLWLF